MTEPAVAPALDPAALRAQLDEAGYAIVPGLVDDGAAIALRAGFEDDERYRSTVVMERHGYGRGVYRYFGYPLPPLVAELRDRCYAALVSTANAWAEGLGMEQRFPPALPQMLALCAEAGQPRPTPLLLRYRAGDYNALHEDRYGEIAFPLQATVLLSEPGGEFVGGEFVLVESKPRRQSVAHVVPLARGDAVIFPNRHRPNARGGRSTFRHGVAALRSGERFTLGIIFHDASD